MDGTTSLSDALTAVETAKIMIREVASRLPASSNPNFRERLVAQMEAENADPELQKNAGALLDFYKNYFGVKDLFPTLDEL